MTDQTDEHDREAQAEWEQRRERYDRRATRTNPSGISTAWKFGVATALLLAAASILLSSALFARSSSDVDQAFRKAATARQAIADKIARKAFDGAVTGCERGNKIREELKRRRERNQAEHRAIRVFVLETRRARANRQGTSYDGRFVHVIDKFVLPAFGKTRYRTFPLLDCLKTVEQGRDVPLRSKP